MSADGKNAEMTSQHNRADQGRAGQRIKIIILLTNIPNPHATGIKSDTLASRQERGTTRDILFTLRR